MAADSLSVGQQLYGNGLRQGAYFPSTIFDEANRQDLTDSRVFKKYRNPQKNSRKIVSDDLLIVFSQDCDISCKNDDDDPLIELGVFKLIDPKKVYPGNSFARSVRKLNLVIKNKNYIADIHHIVWCKKSHLFEALSINNFSDVYNLDSNSLLTCITWRANRYTRLALPDSFNRVFYMAFNTMEARFASTPELQEIYIRLDSYDERDIYQYEILALLDVDIIDDKLSTYMGLMEDLSDLLIKAGYKEYNETQYCLKKDEISVHDLSNFRKMSLEYISLSGES